MGADIKQLRVRIKSVDNTLHLTRAMGLVASSKMRRANEAMLKGRQYAEAVHEMVERLCADTECAKSPYMEQREGGKTRLMVIAGDRGLAGGYNANIFRLMREYPDAQVVAVGKRACERYGTPLLYTERFSYVEAQRMALAACEDFLGGEIDRFGIVYTKYHSMMSQEASLTWLLPLSRTQVQAKDSIVFEPDAPGVLQAAIPEYVAGMMVACAKESFAGEVAARRVAMDSAGKNAQQMLDDLGLAYNRARQGSITQEITEIVAGSGL